MSTTQASAPRRSTKTWSSAGALGLAAVITAVWLTTSAPAVSPVAPVSEGGVLVVTDNGGRGFDDDGGNGNGGRDGDGGRGGRGGNR